MKKLLIILISLLLLTSCSSTSPSNNDSSIKEVDINENTTDVSDNDITKQNDTNTINTEQLESEYNNISINNDNNEEYIYTSELLGIKAIFNINEYRPLSKQEIIDKYHYAKDIDYENEIIEYANINGLDYTTPSFLTERLNHYLGESTYTYIKIGSDYRKGFELIQHSIECGYPVIVRSDEEYGDFETAFGYSYSSKHYQVGYNAYYDKSNIRRIDVSDPYNKHYDDENNNYWKKDMYDVEHPIGQKITNVNYDKAIAHSELYIIYHQ